MLRRYGTQPFGVADFHIPFANDFSTGVKVVRDGSSDTYHRHFGQIVEDLSGKLHLWYGRNTVHGVTSGATTYYCTSVDGGETWSTEQEFITSASGYDCRNMSAGITPSGRLIFIYGVVKSNGTAPTVFRMKYSDNKGASWSDGPDIVTVNYAYARSYGRIKVIPGSGTKPYRLAWTPYYQSSTGPSTYKVAVWTSSDDGLTWTEGTPVVNNTTGHSETEIVAMSSTVWFAVCRGPLTIFKTTDAGATWASVGTVPATSLDNQVAPTLDKFCYQGKWYLLLGFCDRDSDVLRWRIVDAKSLLSSTTYFGGLIDTATDMVNASGYQCPITKPDGTVYFEEGTAFIEFKEYTGGPTYSQVRFRTVDFVELSAASYPIFTVATGAITVPDNRLMTMIGLDTEASAATDDLDTINGGYNGQIITFRSNIATSARDVILKSGTGNLILNGDYRMNTHTASAITLIKMYGYWHELNRVGDQTPTTCTIASGVITVPTGIPGMVQQIFVDTEAAAATDDLDTINGGVEGQLICLSSPTSSRDPTIKDGTGNIQAAGGDFLLSNVFDMILLIKRSTSWAELGRNDNA